MTRIEKTANGKKGKLRVAAYCRVSTSMDSQLESLAAQKSHYLQVIEQNSEWEYVDIYYDEGITGTKKDVRPGLLRLLGDCKEGMIDLILTKSISRFSRNTTDCLEMVRDLHSQGIGIFFERENLNTLKMDDEFLLTVLGSLAENESLSISENIKWANRKRFMNGTFRQSMAPYGYVRSEDGLVIDQARAPTIRFIFDELCSGKGAYSIAMELNARGISPMKGGKWSKKTVIEIVQNERYVGDALYQKTFSDEKFVRHKNTGEYDQFLHKDHHEAIISREQFSRAQAIMEQHRIERGIEQETDKYHNRYLFSAKLFCGECDGKLNRVIRKRRNGEEFISWVCRKHLSDKDACSMQPVQEESIRTAFVTVTNKLIFGRKEILAPFVNAIQKCEIGDAEEQIQDLDQKMAVLTQKEQALIALAGSGLLGAAVLRKAQSDISTDRAELRERKELLSAKTSAVQSGFSEGRKLLKRIGQKEISEEFDEELFRDLVRKVYVYSGTEFGFEFTCGLIFKEEVTVK